MSINNWIWRNSLSGKAFETKIDSNSIESPHPRAASFKQLYRTRPARLPEPTCALLMGRIRYSTSVSGPRVERRSTPLDWSIGHPRGSWIARLLPHFGQVESYRPAARIEMPSSWRA